MLCYSSVGTRIQKNDPLLSLTPSPSSLSDYFRLSVRLGLTSDGGMESLQRLSSITDTDLSLRASATSAFATTAATGATPRHS